MVSSTGNFVFGAASALLLALALPCPAQTPSRATQVLIENAARKSPVAACADLEHALSDTRDEADRRALLDQLVALAPAAAAPPNQAEVVDLAMLTRRSLPNSTHAAGRYAFVIGTPEVLERARSKRLLGQIDAAYLALRELFGVDPVALDGYRFKFFAESTTPGGWSTHFASLTVRFPHSFTGDWDDAIAHELVHGFLPRHPARHLFANGFNEGLADLAMEVVNDRLACLGAPFAGRAAWHAGVLAESGRVEYLDTRLPIEEIVAYAPASSVYSHLAHARGAIADWTPLARLLHATAKSPPAVLPGYLWPARMARDLEHAYGSERAWDVLALYRFPLDGGSRREVDRWEQRARKSPPPTRAETWKAEGHEVVRNWRVLGPIADATGRDLDFDPFDAWNGATAPDLAWRDDATVDEDGIVELSKLAGGDARCVFLLETTLPSALAGDRTFFIASDDACAVWVDGELVHLQRDERGVNVDDPDRAFARVKANGSRVLVQVANYGGAAGFHLRTAAGTNLDTSWRADLRSSDEKRRLLATRWLGSRRIVSALVLDLLEDALADVDAKVRAAAAFALAGRRNEERVVEALLTAWSREKSTEVAAALRDAFEELTFERTANAGEARAWWRSHAADWRRAFYVEAERAYPLRSIFGGFYGNATGSYGRQHIGRAFGSDPGHGFELVLESRDQAPRTLRLRYAAADGARSAKLRVRRGETTLHELPSVPFQKTDSWTDWRWVEIPTVELTPGRYRIELSNANGPIDFDVLGWRPAPGR